VTSAALLNSAVDETAAALVAAARVTKTVVIELHWEIAGAESDVAATRATAEVVVGDAAVAVAAIDAAPPPLKVNDWLASALLQGALSRILAEVTVKHVPTAFVGSSANGPAPPANANSCEFVTAPPAGIRFAV